MENEHTGTMAGEPKRSSSAEGMPGLVLVHAPAAEWGSLPAVIPLERGSTVLGRDPPPGSVTLPITSVSRIHARIDRSDAGCRVLDLRSKNGVLVGGRAVDSAELRNGDDLRIGDALFIFVEREIEAHRPTMLPRPHAAMASGPATRRLIDALAPIATSSIPVLVLGETGTGKELMAEAVHHASRRTGAFRALNCAAMPANLVESELFGFKRGAFSGADRDKPGIVRAAHGGTLFLDEIGDLPLEIQPKLLRLLEASEISPIGAAHTEKVDVRFVCATHADLPALVESKAFRADLYSRIRGYTVLLPPLRERKFDIPFLVRALLARLERPNATLSIAFVVALVRYDWPFNVRELFAVLRRAVALAGTDETLDVKHLPDELLHPAGAPAAPGGGPRPEAPSAAELDEALRANDGNIAAVARIFRRDRSLIHRWLKQHGLDAGAHRRR